MTKTTKVFGIGLHKTGTSTLTECLRILGYCVCPESEAYPTIDGVAKNRYRHCLLLAKTYDAFADSPWNFINAYKVLNTVFPTAKFILTVRRERSWYDSYLRWVSLNDTADASTTIATLGGPFGVTNRPQMVGAYRKHNHDVESYFRKIEEEDKTSRLLVVDWEGGDGWIDLCEFLGKPLPSRGFPHMLKYDAESNTYVNTVRQAWKGT